MENKDIRDKIAYFLNKRERKTKNFNSACRMYVLLEIIIYYDMELAKMQGKEYKQDKDKDVLELDYFKLCLKAYEELKDCENRLNYLTELLRGKKLNEK